MRSIFISVFAFSLVAAAQAPAEKKAAKEVELKKKEASLVPDKSLAGDITRKKEKRDDAPSLKYDEFRTGVELQVAAKRREQIIDLQKIIELSRDKQEKPGLLFRLGELHWEESKYFSFEGNNVHCREGYDSAAALLAHLDNVGALVQEALTIASLARLEVHAPAAELAKLREPLAGLAPTFFTVESGLRR